MKLEETTVKKNYVFKGKLINVRRDDALLPDGNPCIREIVEHPDGVAILPIEDGYVYMVEQFRYPYGKVILEVPAGKKDENETPLHCAIRELEEETGLVADEMIEVGYTYPSPGFSQEDLYVFIAKGLKKGKVHLDEDEFLNVKKISLAEAKEMVRTNKIKDAKTVIALLYYFTYLQTE